MESAATSPSETLGWNRVPPFVGAEGEMVLDPVALEDLRAAVVHMDRQGHHDSPFGHQQALPQVLLDVEIIRDQAKLFAGHIEGRILVDFHRRWDSRLHNADGA